MEIKKKKKMLVFLLIGCLGCIVALGIYYFVSQTQSSSKENNMVEQGTVRYDSKFKKNQEGNIIFPAYTDDIILKKNQKELPVLLVNPLANKNIYLQYKISITENPKKKILLGETKLIKAGEAAKGISVSQDKVKNLAKKVYKCRIDVLAFKYSDEKKEKTNLNQAYWDIKLHLE